MLLLSLINLGCDLPNTNIFSIYFDDVHLADYFLQNNKVENVIYFDDKSTQKEEIKFHYETSGKLISVDIKGDNSISGINTDLAIKLFKDAIIQKRILDNHNVSVPLPLINTMEIRDISYLINSIDDFKDTLFGSERLIVLNDINQSFRFEFSYLEDFINTSNNISQYLIFLNKDNIVTKEQIFFDEGKLERSYNWINDEDLRIIVKCKYKNGDITSMEKKILIH
jgi:hypothetical protein